MRASPLTLRLESGVGIYGFSHVTFDSWLIVHSLPSCMVSHLVIHGRLPQRLGLLGQKWDDPEQGYVTLSCLRSSLLRDRLQ